MTTSYVSRVGIRKVSTSVMIAVIAVAAGNAVLTRTAAADDTALANQISASDPNGDQQTIVQDGVVTQTTPVQPDRNIIDPGSLFRVDQMVNDSFGRTYRETGYRWTSLGVPHSNLTLSRIISYSVAPDPVLVVRTVPSIHYYHSYYPHSYPSVAYSYGYHGGYHWH